MDTAEREAVRELAHQFARDEIRPHAARWDQERAIDDALFEKLAELGFMGMTVPEDHGGLDLDPVTYVLVLEALAWGEAGLALSVAIHNGPVTAALLARGSEAQKERWLPALASGEALGAFALSEPGAGSDAAGLELRAIREGSGWRLDGAKRWVTNGDRAALVVVFARTDPDAPRREGIGAFLVPRESHGYRVTGRERTMGLRASETVAVEFDGVRVGGDALLGDPTAGYPCALDALVVGRLGAAAQAVGIGQAAHEHAVAYALEREQFGSPIARFGAIQEKLAGMATRLEGARALTERAARQVEDGGGIGGVRAGGGPRSAGALAAMAKLAASEAAVWTADEAVQIFGGYGYMRDYPVEKLLRDARGTEIHEGTSEILRYLVAREIVDEAS